MSSELLPPSPQLARPSSSCPPCFYPLPHSYEALKKAIPSPASPVASKPARPSYTDLESAPLLPSSNQDDISESHQPFFDLLAKELRKIAKFYESEEQRLIQEGQTLEKEIEDEETREERDREREVAEWAAQDREDGEGLQDVGEEGESTIGSLGVHLGGQVAAASRGRMSRSRSANGTRGEFATSFLLSGSLRKERSRSEEQPC